MPALGGSVAPDITVNSNQLKPSFLMHHYPKAWLATVVLEVGQKTEMPVPWAAPGTVHGGPVVRVRKMGVR